MPLRLVVADDHHIVRRSLCRLIESEERFFVVAEAEDGRTAVQRCLETNPDVALLDVNMPVISGITAAAEIKAKLPDTGIVMLTFQLQLDTIRASLSAGADAYVLKDSTENELFAAIESAARGRKFVAQRAAEVVLETLTRVPSMTPGTDETETDPLRQLSSRERQVLQMLAEGAPNNEIARTLHLSAKTVETYRSRLMHKMNVGSFAELVRIAVRAGLVDQQG